MQKLHTVSIMYEKLKITETELEVRDRQVGNWKGDHLQSCENFTLSLLCVNLNF